MIWTCVDIETTGTSPEHSAIIQIAAAKFNPWTREIKHNFFNRCLLIPADRKWDESTRQWWAKQPDTLRGIMNRMECPRVVMTDFYDWIMEEPSSSILFAKPISFEHPFLTSYFQKFDFPMPFDFRVGRDMRSFIAGLSHPGEPFDEKSVSFEGTEHDAIFDVLHQIKVLFAALNHKDSPDAVSGSD